MLDRKRGYHTFVLEVDKPKIISAQLNLFREKENLNWLFFNQINTKICITSINRLNKNVHSNTSPRMQILIYWSQSNSCISFIYICVWKLNQTVLELDF